jgi:transcription-repair coupling factor (superfamily II helicase)
MIDGYAFAAHPEKEDIFLKSFKYVHTDDQLAAIYDIRADMEKPVPMDRLLAGDVGFGKTEVAMNAIYKAVLSGAQVACISPLLVLADEHAETFLERFSPYGIRVARLSRMSSIAEQKNIIK